MWLAHGVRGDFTDYSGTPKLAARPNWQPPDEFFAAHDGFVERASALR